MSTYKNTQLIKSDVKGCHQENSFPDDSYILFNPLSIIVTGREDSSNIHYIEQNIKDLEEWYK